MFIKITYYIIVSISLSFEEFECFSVYLFFYYSECALQTDYYCANRFWEMSLHVCQKYKPFLVLEVRKTQKIQTLTAPQYSLVYSTHFMLLALYRKYCPVWPKLNRKYIYHQL